MKKLLSLILAGCLLAAGIVPAYSQPVSVPRNDAGDVQAEYVQGTLLFALPEEEILTGLTDDLAGLGLGEIEPLFTENGEAVGIGGRDEIWYRARVSGDVPAAVQAVSELEGVVCAEPEYIYTSDQAGVPSEIECGRDWPHDRLHKHDGGYWWSEDPSFGHSYAPGEGTVVAVIDTGVDYLHEDLKANMWVNYAEIDGTAGVDDDGNGCIDDIHGVNVTAGGAAAGNPMDDNGHGTHVAGIIAMSANEKGGVGLAYGAEIMAIKAGQSTGTFASADIARAINYAVMMGADVINMSFGGSGKSYLIETALETAFTTCVLVASAGNDGIPTTDAPPELYPRRVDIYPAGYSYVLGVMAVDESGSLASFSNWDYEPGANCEYEMTAPGVGIYSALPGNRYALWNGTSMAAPYVSAAAAILRSHFTDKDMYSSRFIMGQLCSATEDRTEFYAPMGEYYLYPALNVYDSISLLPKPGLFVKETFLLDNADIAEINDGDAIIDAGETVDLGILVRNQWGLTGETTVTADAVSIGGVANPYIDFITDEITLDPAGTFQESDNGFVCNDSYLESVGNPIRFAVAENCPNDAEICINLTVTTTNGADENDDAVYTAAAKHTFRVQAGRGVRGTIDEDTTWTKDFLWIIENSVYIPEGVTLTVEPGTQVQFYSSDYEDAYGGKTIAKIVNEGTLNMIGTEDEPIELFPGREFEEYVVEISGTGVETLEYCNVINPYFGGGTYDEAVDFVDHCSLTQNTEGVYYRRISGGSISESHVESQRILRITNTQLIGIRPERDSMFYELRTNLAENCLFDSCLIDSIETFSSSLIFENNALLKGEAGEHSPFDASSYYNASPTVEPPELRVASEVYTDEETGRKYLCVYLAAEGEEFEYNYLKAAARALGGDLLSINDDSELAFLTSVIWDGKNYELGIYYNDFTRRYEWADGNTYSIDIKPYNSNNPNTLGHNWPFVGLSFATGSYQADYKIDRSVLEFPADVADEDILSCFEDFDYKSWAAEYANQYRNNAILNPLLNTAPELWTRFISEEFDYDYLPNYITGNYWGTENDRLIDKMIVDGNDYAGTYQELVYEPILTLESGSLEDIYPFVTEILLEDEDGNIVSDVQPGEAYAVHVFFNRDMNREVQPAVTFGGALPYTDYSVHGDFVSEREWVGTAFISPVMNSGTMYFKTTGGCAADDSWLVCGDDVLRFSFEVESVGVLAMLLNAEGGTNKVTLSWAQNDYEVLGGYNLYRSTSEDSGFAKLNTSVLTGTSYEDTDVEPGVMYYYYFKVVNTEGNEEENTSNIASAKPIDNIAPVLTHSVIKKAKMNTRITVSADASDNIAVSGVVLYYRTAGAEKFKSVDMMNTSGTRYVGTIPASAVTADGVEYYLAASDEDGNIRYSGTEQLPNFIEVDSAPAVTGVTPQQLNIAGGQTVTILGVNFSEGMTLTLGGTVISEYTLVNSGQITFTAPAMKSGRYALVLTDADGRTAAAKEQIVYTDESSVAQIPTAMEMLSGVEYMIPFVAAADSAVTAVHFELDLPSAYFRDVRAEKADADANFTLDYNYSGSLLQVSCIGTADMITQNALVNVFVTPMSTEKISLPVNMHDVRFNGSDVHTVISGTAQITPVFTLDAEVRLWADDAPLAGAVVRADGRTGTTGNDGRVSLTVVNKLVDAAVSCTVPVPSGTITAYDASLVLQNSVGKIELNEYQLIAGDVTGDGRTDEYDASVILQMAVRKISAFPCGCSWSFLPASVSMEMEASGNSAEFTAICMGDVDGSFGMDEEIGATE